MNIRVTPGGSTSNAGSDPRAALKSLEASLPHLRQTSDLAGLTILHREAKALGEALAGRARKRAERVAEKASVAAEDLKRRGTETQEERQAREAREADEARWEAQEAKTRLLERLVSLLHLLLSDGSPATEGVAVLRGLAMADGEGYLKIEIPEVFGSSSPLLIDGYERSRQIFQEVGARSLQKERQSIERTLKIVAVELMTAGAEVRGLTADAVPLVAYSLFGGKLPDSSDAADPVAAAKVDNLLLRIADEVAAMPIENRPLFIGLFRLAVLLGEAQAYAEKVSLTALSLS